MSDQEIVGDLLGEAVAHYKDEYKDLSETWRHIDTKAQGVVAVAGVLVGVSVVLVRTADPADGSGLVRVVASAGLVSLMVSVVCAVLALKLRESKAAPQGDVIATLVADLAKSIRDDGVADRLPDFYREQIAIWRDVNSSVALVNKVKAQHLGCAQRAIMVAVMMGGFIGLCRLWGSI